jgi:hypothetical protein
MLNQLKEKYSQKFAASIQELRQRLSPTTTAANLNTLSPVTQEDPVKIVGGELTITN